MKILHRHTGEVILEVEGTNLQGTNLQGTNLQNADLRYADLQGANLQNADLQGADLQGANLQNADLQGADLQGANLQNADFRNANLRYADLQGANLQNADFRNANLRNANLRCTVGNMREIRSAQFDSWPVVWTSDVMAIGCQQHSIEEWFNFTDGEIDDMDHKALRWWKKYRDIIRALIDASNNVASKGEQQ